MSLDVYLYGAQSGPAGSGIFVRENGSVRELSRAEWDEHHPGQEPVVVEQDADSVYPLFDANITHNLGAMAEAAGLYSVVWRPDENGIVTAGQLIEPLRQGLDRLEAFPEKFKQMNPSNGWGSYEGFVGWIERYLRACEEWPDATVRVSR